MPPRFSAIVGRDPPRRREGWVNPRSDRANAAPPCFIDTALIPPSDSYVPPRCSCVAGSCGCSDDLSASGPDVDAAPNTVLV